MLQRLGIRGKLLAVVAVPTIVLLLAASFVVLNASSAYTSGRDTTKLVNLVESGSPVIAALQAERSDVSGYLRAISDGKSDRVIAQTNVDTAVAALTNAGVTDPAFAAIANQITAAIVGTNVQFGLNSARAVAPVPATTGAFPVWPDATESQTVSDTFEHVAKAVTDIVNVAPVSDTGNVARGLPALIRAEGRASKAYLDDSRTAAEALPAEFAKTDQTGAVFLGNAAQAKSNSNNEGVIAFVNGADKGLQALAAVRAQVAAGTVLFGPAVTAYTTIVNDLLGATSEVANIAGDRTLSNDLKGYASMGKLVEALRNEEAYVTRKIAQGTWRLGEQVQYQAYYFATNTALANAQTAVALLPDVTPVPKFGASYDPSTIVGFESIRDRIINDATTQGLLSQRTNNWPLQVDEEIAAYAPITTQLTSDVNGRAAPVQRNSLLQTLATAVIAVLAVAASLFVALAISRRIVNPLRRLTTTATAVRQELPRLVERVAMPGQTVDLSEVQIPVESQDEVGRLAEAFNSVNAATLAIASEQAALRGSISEMFVNVARRDQVLLNRQLASIDEMERTEDNQDTLTKLFALDHLATRMRRNSESLLVLAGIDTGRRLRRPMPLSDVIRTASSEIELYERIQLELDADPAMLGHSALTAAHLFAELLENATVFSDPGTQVVVRTMERDGAFVVTIVDHGIGMTSEELGEANSRVASTAASEIIGAQRLGLFVVGRIARRVGARVHIESAEGRGTEATVIMPPSLFDTSVAYTQGHSSGTTADDQLHAPAALVHHDASIEEISEPALNSRGLSAYQPTVIEDGAILAGRPADAPDLQPPPAPLAPRGVPQPAEAQAIDELVAADAAQAPAAVAVDLDDFTEGVTEVGLPTRRRRPRGVARHE
ncbi:sensor histidine kinase [Demequina lutea]|uniref:histidine kinase n=1 Tax=Demequina lutea TaxID=431489 RepID=A0A7Y9Z8T2_9MICO|nr:sensor histidine kinase [Demequina lutea]NYI40083.1 signal transduction histidine kinase [Demequina lutea]